MNWRLRKLEDCARFLSGGTPSKSNAEYWTGDIPWVSSGEMTQSFIEDTDLHLSAEGARNGTRMVPKHTVLAVVRGMSLAKEFRVSITQREMTFNQDIKALSCANGIDPHFLFYALKARREYIRELATEASHGTKKLETDSLGAVEILVPESIEGQKAIASVALTYDELIENNRRRVALLEEAARQLYKDWFVRFRFPGHEHVKVIDGQPDGWKRKSIAELSSLLSRGIAPTYDDEASGIVINQKCIRGSKVSLELARRQSKAVPEKKLVRKFDILINSTGAGTLGRVAQNFHEHENLSVDSHVTIVRPAASVARVWLGIAIATKQEFIATLGRGATNQTELSKDDVGAIVLNMPTDTILREFEDQVALKAEMVMNLLAQNRQLAKARDLLLPKLMSGAIAV